jgi:hypothetical protein
MTPLEQLAQADAARYMKGPSVTHTHPKDMTEEETRTYLGLRAAQTLAHGTATRAGWYADPVTGKPVVRNFGEVVALMHSELSEALEADRKGLMDDKLPHRDGREVEFADLLLRVLWDVTRARWRAYFCADSKRTTLGYYHCFARAASARKTAEAQHGYHQNHGRRSAT